MKKNLNSILITMFTLNLAYAALPKNKYSQEATQRSYCDVPGHAAGCARAAEICKRHKKKCQKSGITPREWCNKVPTPDNCL